MIPMTEQEREEANLPSVIKVLDPITMAINNLSVEEFIQLMVALEKENGSQSTD